MSAVYGEGVLAANSVSGVWVDADSEYAFGEELSSSFPAKDVGGSQLAEGKRAGHRRVSRLSLQVSGNTYPGRTG